jgi:peptidoglycan/xylan/chitin deacetylase (PgdA/CDA1 family)
MPAVRGNLLFDAPLFGLAVSAAYAGYGWALPSAASLSMAINTWGVISPRSSFYLPVTWRLPAGDPAVALTFDDGPHPEITPRVLDLLAAAGQHATFFCIGEHVERHPQLVRRILAEGHALGLHSHTHSRWFNTWLPGRVSADLRRAAEVCAAATGVAAPRLFRPPVGLKNPMLAIAVAELGLRTVTWSCRGMDTTQPPVELLLQRLVAGLAPRAIILLHDGHEPGRPADRSRCVEVLRRLLPIMAERGVRSRALNDGGNGRSGAERI